LSTPSASLLWLSATAWERRSPNWSRPNARESRWVLCS
jgi:hypothetical protein